MERLVTKLRLISRVVVKTGSGAGSDRVYSLTQPLVKIIPTGAGKMSESTSFISLFFFNSLLELPTPDPRGLRRDILMFAACSPAYSNDEVGGFPIPFEH